MPKTLEARRILIRNLNQQITNIQDRIESLTLQLNEKEEDRADHITAISSENLTETAPPRSDAPKLWVKPPHVTKPGI